MNNNYNNGYNSGYDINYNNQNQNTEQQSNNKKKNKGPIVIIFILAIAVSLSVGYILGNNIFNKSESEDKQNNVENKDDAPIEEPKTEEPPVEEPKKEETKECDCSECTAKVAKDSDAHTFNEEVKYYPTYIGPGVTLKILYGGKKVNLSINNDKVNNLYHISLKRTIDKDISFDKKVVQVYCDGMGQAAGGEVILFLMEDGTVEYIPLYKELTAYGVETFPMDKIFNSYGKIKGVKDVVRLFSMNVEPDIVGGYYSIGALRADNTFYNLSEYNLTN
jgi:hypothetical protein